MISAVYWYSYIPSVTNVGLVGTGIVHPVVLTLLVAIVWSKDGSSIISGGRFTISTMQLGSEPVTSVLEIDNF